MDTSHFVPVQTCDIPRPIVELPASGNPAALPRILLQRAGARTASRRVAILAALFLAVSLFEALLLARLRVPEPVIYYHNLPRTLLMEARR